MSRVTWNPEKIDQLTGEVLEVMDSLEDEELAWIIQQLLDDNWEDLLEDRHMNSFLAATMILGLSSFAYRRRQ